MIYGCELYSHVTLARSAIDVVIPIPIAPTQGCSKCCDTADSEPLLGIVNQFEQVAGVWFRRGVQGHRVSSLAAVSPQGRLQARGIGLLFPWYPARVTMAQVK